VNTGQLGIWAQDLLNAVQRIAVSLEDLVALAAEDLDRERNDEMAE
jgi:hypothetical protein